MIGRTISHYEILEEIGGGGMGTVYKALDTKLNVHRSLKIIHSHLVSDEQFRQRFILEAQAASSLDHPNICSIHEVDETEAGRPFICMTYYDGATLSDRMREAPLPAADVFGIGLAIAQGLACAHHNGIVHRDIKPGNVMITTDGYVKILDFGLAKLMGSTSVTRAGVVMGTARYMSPEQVSGAEADHRTDLWSLGVVMYELATGQAAFAGDFESAIGYAVLHTEPRAACELNPDLPEELSDIIARCLRKDPAERYASAGELAADLVRIAPQLDLGSGQVDLVLPLNASAPHAALRKSRAPLWALLGTVLAVAAGTIGYGLWRSPPSLYATEQRVAVMPLTSRVHPAYDRAVQGLWQVVYEALDMASRRQGSMWVVPNRLVEYAELAEDGQARGAFGVNRIVTGELQRFAGGQVLLLELRDAASLQPIRTATVTFDSLSSACADSLPMVIADLVGGGSGIAEAVRDCLPAGGPAAYGYLVGLGLMQDGMLAEAVDRLRAVAAAAPGYAPARSNLGWARWQLCRAGDDDQCDAAFADLAAAVDEAPGAWRPRYRLGEALRGAGRTDEALEAYGAADRLDPGNPLVCRRISRIYESQERFAEARTVLAAAVERRPDYFEASRLLAMFFYRTNEDESALEHLGRSLNLAPDDVYALNSRGAVHMGRGEFARARADFERAFALAPKCETCANVGLMLFHEGKYAESASYYELAFEYCGDDNPLLWANLANALYWTGSRRDESIPRYRRAIELTRDQWERAPGDPLVFGNLVEYHVMIGDNDTARRLLAQADTLAAGNAEVLYQVGEAYEAVGDRGAALRYVTDAIRHGIPVEQVRNTPMLADLVADPRFERMTSAAAPGTAAADSVR